jgi:hypothetical protein
MNYPAELIRRLGSTTDGILYVKYISNELNIVKGDNIISIKPDSTINCCVLHGDYIYYSTSAVEADGISVHKICVNTLNNIILFTSVNKIYGNLTVLDTAIGVLVVLDSKVFTESGEYLPVFIDTCLEDESEIIHYNSEIIISMNIFSEELENQRIEKMGQFAIFSLISQKRIFVSAKNTLSNTRKYIYRKTDFESECEDNIYEMTQKTAKKNIKRYKKSITALGGSRIILYGNLIQLNHRVVEISTCYICEDEIYIKPISKVYVCSHPDLAHPECLNKTKCCPLCRETKRC